MVNVPVVVSGGMGKLEHLKEILKLELNGIAIASVLHYEKIDITSLKNYIKKNSKKDVR